MADFRDQVIWGFEYIRSRYGQPGDHRLECGWYDHGGDLPPGQDLRFDGDDDDDDDKPA